MDDQATTFGSRTGAFSAGYQGTPDVATSLGLDAQRIREGTPSGFTPQSVLHQYQRSGIGMSAQDASRRFIGQDMPQPSFNGTAKPQQEQVNTLRALGGE